MSYVQWINNNIKFFCFEKVWCSHIVLSTVGFIIGITITYIDYNSIIIRMQLFIVIYGFCGYIGHTPQNFNKNYNEENFV